MKRIIPTYLVIVLLSLGFTVHNCLAEEGGDPLPSWQDRPIKQSIIQFVQNVTDESSQHYVPPNDRIAVIDNDGTLWVEQPLYTQFLFALDRIKELALENPSWQIEEPFKSVLNNQYFNLNRADFEKILAVTQTGMPVENYHKLASDWLETSRDVRFKRRYTELVYEPMLEVIRYLQANNFKVFIVSGGGQDFIRVFSEKVYGIPRERIIGTAGKTDYLYQNSQAKLIKMPDLLLGTNKAGKVKAIHLFIGKRPIIAIGNSTGDKEMLEWTQSGGGEKLMLLVHHDDALREYAYDTRSRVGTFSQPLMDEANRNGWKVISMQHDWKKIFPFEETVQVKEEEEMETQ